MNDVKDKLSRWLEENPDGWLRESYKSIAEAAGVSATSVDRYLIELIADRDGIMPSEVLRQREEAGLRFLGRAKADQEKIRKVIEENPGAHYRDIAYLAKCNPKTVKRILKAIEQEREEDHSADNEDEIRDIDAQIAKLQEERRAALSKN